MVNSYKGVSINHVDVDMEGEGVLALFSKLVYVGEGGQKTPKTVLMVNGCHTTVILFFMKLT